MKTKKNFLFGLIGAGALILSGSVGFAAWTIINNKASKNDSTLHISADATVNDESISITRSEWDSTKSVQFKPVKEANKQYKYSWLGASEELTAESLTAIFEIDGKAPKGKTVNITATFTETTNDATETYSSLVTKGIVAELPTPHVGSSGSSDNTGTAVANQAGEFKASVSVEFGWGTKFGNVNPYEHYNNLGYTPELATEAKKNIEYLQYLENCKFQLTVDFSIAD